MGILHIEFCVDLIMMNRGAIACVQEEGKIGENEANLLV